MNTGRGYKYKLVVLTIVLFLSVLKVLAQDPYEQTSTELRSALQKSKPDTGRISLLFKLGDLYLYRPMIKEVEIKNNLDSAIKFLNHAQDLSIQLHETDWQYKVLERIGLYYSADGDKERCKQIYLQVITHYHQNSNASKEAHAWESLAEGYHYQDSQYLNETINYYQHSRSLYLQIHQPLNAAIALNEIADAQIVNKQFDVAKKELLQVLAEYKSLGYGQLEKIYTTLYNLEYDKGNYYRAMSYCLQAIKNLKLRRNTLYDAYFYAENARCNYAVGKYKESLLWIRKALVARKQDITYRCIVVQNLLALNRTDEARIELDAISRKKSLRTGQKVDLYKALALYYDKTNKNGLAIQYYLKVLEIITEEYFNESSMNTLYVLCNNEIGGLYLKANQVAKAGKYLNNTALAFKNVKTALDPILLVTFYNNSYKYDMAIGAYRAAIYDLQRRVHLQDSLFTVDKDKQLAELDIQYQTAQQEQSIKNLHSQGIAQKAKLEKANLQRNITIGGILVMILVSALFYRNYKQKQRANNIITHKNELLQHLLTEKEWLLKEVHHRVKNNLHTVICLLESQSRYLENDALKAIENSQHRIYAMSLIHQKLYQSDDIKTIDMSEYIPELVGSLEDGFGTLDQVKFKLKIDPVNLDISHAIPIGLIINEAVTNSIKYAFPDNRKGEISISMIDEGEQIKLELADNGIGMPHIDMEDEPESLGLRLMKGLSEDIDADISFEVDNGTRIIIIFKPDTLNNPEGILRPSETREVGV